MFTFDSGVFGDMLQIEGHALFSALRNLTIINSVATGSPDWVYKDQEKVQYINNLLDDLRVELDKLGLRLSVKKVNLIKTALMLTNSADSGALSRRVSYYIEELQERIEQELEERVLYYVTQQEAQLINNGAKQFSQIVTDKFSDAITDLDEAAQCLGLSRNTACVFHLMRAMEVALYTVGQKFSATIIDKNDKPLAWGIIIANINKKVQELLPGEEHDQWAAIVALLHNVKDCWRNTTMHPKQTYTPEEAHAVFSAVKTFMNRLAQEI